MAKFTLVFYCKRPSKNRLTQNEIDCCLLWLEYLVGAFELLSTVLSTDDGVTDFWFLNFRLFTPEKRKKTALQLDSIEVSTAVIYGLILQQVFPYAEPSYTLLNVFANVLAIFSSPIFPSTQVTLQCFDSSLFQFCQKRFESYERNEWKMTKWYF